MKRFYNMVMAVASLAALSSCSIRNEINELHRELDEVRFVEVPTIGEQLLRMEGTIDLLQKADAELQSYIEQLQEKDRLMNESIVSVGEAIETARTSMFESLSRADEAVRESLSLAVVELDANFASYRSLIEGECQLVEDAIDSLFVQDSLIRLEIAALKTYAAEGFSENKEWAKGSFALLSEYERLSGVAESVFANVINLTTDFNTLKDGLDGRISAAMDKMSQQLSSEMSQKVSEAISTCNSQVDAMKEELLSAFNSDLASTLSQLRTSLESWFDGILAPYCKKDVSDSLIAAMASEIKLELSSHKAYLESLMDGLSSSLLEGIEANGAAIDSLETFAGEMEASNKDLADSLAKYSRIISQNASDILVISAQIAELQADTVSSATARLISENERRLDDVRRMADELAYCASAMSSVVKEIAQNDEEIAEQARKISENSRAIAANKSALEANAIAMESLASDMTEAKAALLESFRTALGTAIEENKGLMEKRISDLFQDRFDDVETIVNVYSGKIQSARESVTSCRRSINSLNASIIGLMSDMDALSARLDSLNVAVKSICVVPYYSDGSVKVSSEGDAEIRLEVFPAAAAARIAENFANTISLELIYSDSSIDTLVPSSALCEGNLVLLSIPSSSFKEGLFSGSLSAMAAIKVTEKSLEMCSSYFTLRQ